MTEAEYKNKIATQIAFLKYSNKDEFAVIEDILKIGLSYHQSQLQLSNQELIKERDELKERCIEWAGLYDEEKRKSADLQHQLTLLQSTNEELRGVRDTYNKLNVRLAEDLRKANEQLEELRKERGELIGFLKAHEQWEADFIGEDSMWWPQGKNGDVLQGKLYESFLELQSKRNAWLNDVMEKNGASQVKLNSKENDDK